MFLTKQHVEDLTGFKRPSRQCRWLANHGYRFEVNAAGWPVVLSSVVEQKLGLAGHSERQPNFEVLHDGS